MADPVLQIRGNGGEGGGVRSSKKFFLALWASDLSKNKCVGGWPPLDPPLVKGRTTTRRGRLRERDFLNTK